MAKLRIAGTLFPARAGMNRITATRISMSRSVPRTSGDEPKGITEIADFELCSPHERG